jgi:hypothetical protein
MGTTVNGRKNWKVEATGQTYAEWQDAKLAATGIEPEADDIE